MSVTILEALQNANFNLRHRTSIVVAQSQFHNAVTLLEKEYDLSDLVEPLLEKYGNVEDVPEKNIHKVDFKSILLGQEAICSDGLGRVIAFKNNYPPEWVQIETYADNKRCKWDPNNVELIDPRRRK